MEEVDVSIEVDSKEFLLEALRGIEETRRYILSRYGVRSAEELESLVMKGVISNYDIQYDRLRLDILNEMEKAIYEAFSIENKGCSIVEKAFTLIKNSMSNLLWGREGGVKEVVT